MDDRHEPLRGTSGFDWTRRSVLAAGAAVGLPATLAGCTSDDDLLVEPVEQLVDDDVELLETELVGDDGGWMDFRDGEDGSSLADDYGRTTHVRVRLASDVDETLSYVAVAVELFDEDLEFLGVQTARISSLGPDEVFEGYVPTLFDAAAYVVRIDASDRPDPQAALDASDDPVPPTYAVDEVTAVDDCLDGAQVRGTVVNGNPNTIDRLRVEVTFLDGDGTVLGRGTDTIFELEGQPGTAEFSVDPPAAIERTGTVVEDYEVSVGAYGGEAAAIR